VQTVLGVSADAFRIDEDSTFDDSDSGVAPKAGVTLRYPLVHYGSGGVTHYIEPVVQFGWVGGDGLRIPNEESTRVEFDEGNLLSLSRFPAPDRRERGWAVALGTTWARYDPDGWRANLTLGQVLRQDTQVDFTQTSGLGATTSDFLVAGQVKLDGGLAVSARTLFDERFDVSKAEVRGDWSNRRLDLGGSYVWLSDDVAEDRLSPISELTFGGAFRIDRFWTADLDWRYDLEEGRAATAGAGLSYTNECVTIAMSVNRRYTSSTSVEPSTNLGLTVSLRGFSANTGGNTQTRSCGKLAK
jgi:LPS-assembly protein